MPDGLPDRRCAEAARTIAPVFVSQTQECADRRGILDRSLEFVLEQVRLSRKRPD
jgi:hypothetical protein